MVAKKNILNKQDIKKLSQKQMTTNIQISDMLNKTMAAITVSPTEQRKQTLSGLEQKYLDAKNIKYTYIDSNDLGNYSRSFDWVVTADEYFTFASVEEEQRARDDGASP